MAAQKVRLVKNGVEKTMSKVWYQQNKEHIDKDGYKVYEEEAKTATPVKDIPKATTAQSVAATTDTQKSTREEESK